MFCFCSALADHRSLLRQLALQHNAIVDDRGDAVEKLAGRRQLVGHRKGRRMSARSTRITY